MTDHTTTVLDDTTEDPAVMEAAAVVPQMDLGELLEAAVARAVTASLAARAKKIADGVVEDMLTPEVLAGMRENARLEAELALNAAPSTAPGEADDRGEAEDSPGEVDEQEPQKPELMYRTLDAFVEDHIAHLYRRAVVGKGTERSVRWCPRWWEHGEAIGRLSALWRAFEEMRHGEGAEMASWWVQYADPLMAELLSTAGPFRECSVAKGHVETAKLPTVPAPTGMFEDGHAHDDDPPVPVVSSLELPAPAHSARRMVMEFPG